MSYKVNYSFYFRYDPEEIFSVDVPLELLEGKALDVEVVREIVENDHTLLLELLGEQELKAYEQLSMAPHLFHKDLERWEQTIRLVKVED